MSLAEDQHAIGDRGAGGEDEPFRVRVRPWALRWDLARGDTGVSEHGVEGGGGELAGPVADQDREPFGVLAKVHEQIPCLLGGDTGFNPVFLGPGQHDLLDQLLKLWFTLANGKGRGRHVAFKVLDVAANPVPRGLPTRRERQRPRQGVPLVRTPRTLPRVLEPDQVDALLAALRTHRDRAMAEAMVLGGLRRCEVLGLRLEDLRVAARRVFIAEGKGGHQRLIPVSGGGSSPRWPPTWTPSGRPAPAPTRGS
jgi:hypothetical protein